MYHVWGRWDVGCCNNICLDQQLTIEFFLILFVFVISFFLLFGRIVLYVGFMCASYRSYSDDLLAQCVVMPVLSSTIGYM